MMLPRFFYLSDNELTSLPEWANFFMELGYRLATIPNAKHRLVVGLAIPVRAFASSLVAAGIVIAKAGKEISIDEARLQYIQSLEIGTPVHVRIENRKHKGIVEDFEEYAGQTYIVVCTTSSTASAKPLKRKLPLSRYASKITVSQSDVSLSGKQSGRLMEAPSEFVKMCFGKEFAEEYIHSSSLEALIIGNKSTIQQDACDTFFNCNVSDTPTIVKGCLQDILRIRQFSGTNRSYHTECLSSSTEAPEKEIEGREPSVAILDGAVAYLRHGHKWKSSHQVVLLDRTERQFSDAVDLLNQNQAYRTIEDFEFLINIPNGIEMMIYKE